MEDLTGLHFGKWTVIERSFNKDKSRGTKWLCSCECGTNKVVFGKYLRNGKSTSCGCSHKRKWVGERFGNLVIKSVHRKGGKNVFECLCDCGELVEVIDSSIYSTKSCGCAKYSNHTGERYGMLTINNMLYNLKGDRTTYVSCTCDCGKVGYITRLNGLRTGNTKSCGCVHNPNLIGRQFGRLSVVKQIHSDDTQRRWLCRCSCGKTIELRSHLLLSGHTRSCGCLRSEKNSTAEIFVRDILTEHGINYIAEHTFADCVGINGWRLRFDFYLPEYNLAIECDGEQHYKPISFFGGEERFKTLQRNDAIKNSYCDKNGILLLRLPYTESEDDILKLISIFISIQESRNDHSLKGND